MATNDDDKDYRQGLTDVVRDLSGQLGSVHEQLGAVREQMSRDLADYLARYREDVSRSINALHYRVKDVEDALGRLAHSIHETLEKDAVARADRQHLLDAVLADLKADIEVIKRGGVSRDWRIWLILVLLVVLVIGVWR